MNGRSWCRFAPIAVIAVSLTAAVPAAGQVGKGTIVDTNTATEKDLLAMPHMTPEIVKGIVDKRPFASIVDLNTFLVSQSLTPAQLTELYGKTFIHVNLNTGTPEEILLIPGAGKRMVREFAEYRPWKTWPQFDKEIGKYVGQAETDRLKQYVFIPVNLNTATDEDIHVGPKETSRLWRYVVIQ
jgi:DNA uptake protein ComE-like DNA-binding protein